MSQQLRLLNCPHCDAPIDYSLGETLFTCKSCGYTFSMIKEGEYKEIAPDKHFMLVNKYDETEVQEVFRDWIRARVRFGLKDLAEKSEITMMELRFVPIWSVNISADTTYRGEKKIVEVEWDFHTETEIRTERWVDKSGHFSDVIDWKIPATKGLPLCSRGLSLRPSLRRSLSVIHRIPFKIEKVPPGAKLINGDVDEKLAKEKADSDIRNHHRRRTGVDRLLSINTNVHVGEAQLLTAPFWFTQYKYKNKFYPVILNGASGEVVGEKLPIGKYDVLILAGIMAIIITIVLVRFLRKRIN